MLCMECMVKPNPDIQTKMFLNLWQQYGEVSTTLLNSQVGISLNGDLNDLVETIRTRFIWTSDPAT